MPDSLRRDVRLLTTLLGEAIREHGGEELFAVVEKLRRATIRLHERPTPPRAAAVRRLVAGLDREEAARVARAFTAFFQLVNVAEDRQRARELRAGERLDPHAAVPSSLALTLVLTAHPTEAKRRAVVEHLWRIGDLLETFDDPRESAAEGAETRRRLAEEVSGLWLTDPVRRDRPSPLDEVRASMALFDRTIFTTVPAVYRAAEVAAGGDGSAPPVTPAFLRWSTWVGGDRDGNPLVTAAITTEALAIQRDHVLRGYETAARRIARTLSASVDEVRPSARLRRSLSRDASDLAAVASELDRKLPDAPHRRKLVLIAERLRATRLGETPGYEGPDAFRRDLATLQDSLADSGAGRLAYGDLQHLMWQAETFGFHLASMEIRQHADVFASAGADPDGADTAATMRAIAEAQRVVGPEACRRVIVSFTRSARDVAAAYEAMRLADPALPTRVDVVPLFESGRELAETPRILDDILRLPHVRRRLRANGRRMEVMVGYSDSAKEIGVLAATIALYRAQRALVAWARANDVELTIFHGRGGALGRGGGPTARAIGAQPPGSVGGRFKVTEQGEVAFARYGDPAIARHHLEQLTRAVASAPGVGTADPAERFEQEIEQMASASELAWRSLITTPGFAAFFTKVTPIRQIATLPIASRPVSRTATVEDLDALRAIPWVFAWGQARVNLPGWFGLGTGLGAVASQRGGLGRLRRMHRDWPFLGTVLENAQVSLAKADRGVAARYLARGSRPDLSERILEEWDRTEELVLAVTRQEALLDERPGLQNAIALRAPYVDAFSYLPLKFVDQRRAERLVQATISGVAAGLQNTG